MSGSVIVDYGIGNVYSVCNALEQVGGKPNLTGDLSAIRNADRLILPGVGAFGRAMDALRAEGIADALADFISTGRPFLGICIGMQVLMDRSSEFGQHDGLGFISGRVERIASESTTGSHLRVPHIGWAPLAKTCDDAWAASALEPLQSGGEEVYFVHSYHCVPDDPRQRIAYADYGGREITAAVRDGNVVGVQFHPERSGPVGHKFLQGFLRL